MNSRRRGEWDFFPERPLSAAQNSLRDALERYGFVVIRGLLEASEIDRARCIARDHLLRAGMRFGLGLSQPNAAVAVPGLAFLFTNEKIVALMKKIIGDGQPVFTGHCDVHMNMLSGWHKDSGEAFGGYLKGDYFAARDCRVYKIAVYLQATDLKSGLAVRPGSHCRAALMDGKEFAIETQVGDVVVFDVRLSHTGQRPDLIEKAIKAVSVLGTRGDRAKPDSKVASALEALYWAWARRPDRLSIFFTFGCANQHTFDFATANMARQVKQARDNHGILPADLCDRLRELGVIPFDASTPR